MCKILYADSSYFLKLKRGITPYDILEKIRNNSGMNKGSFADLYVNKIFYQILCNAENLFDDYTIYYNCEYSSFEEYLYKKQAIDMLIIKKFELKIDEHLWKLHIFRNGYNGKSILGYNNENLEILNNVIGGIVNEI